MKMPQCYHAGTAITAQHKLKHESGTASYSTCPPPPVTSIGPPPPAQEMLPIHLAAHPQPGSACQHPSTHELCSLQQHQLVNRTLHQQINTSGFINPLPYKNGITLLIAWNQTADAAGVHCLSFATIIT